MNDGELAARISRLRTSASDRKEPSKPPQKNIDEALEARRQPAVYRCMSDIEAQPIRWLWPGRIARGKVSMIAGNPGLGKSQLACAVAAIVTAARCWPLDQIRSETGNVVFISGEDDPADTIKPRLVAAGADVARCYILDMVHQVQEDGSTRLRSFSLQTGLNALECMLERIGGAALVVIDPVSAYLGSVDSHKNADIRALLDPLSKLASKWDCAIVCISHLNKGGANTEALARVTGSLAFVAAARSTFVVVKDKGDERRRLFLPAKNNLAPDAYGLAYHICGVTLGGGIETSLVEWETEPVTISADDAMRPLVSDQEGESIADAKAFLSGLLADGAVSQRQVRVDADGAGHSWRTIQRAKKALGIEAVKEGMRGGWIWKLPPEGCEVRHEDAKNAT